MPSRKEDSTPKSTICNFPHRQTNAFSRNVLYSDRTKIELFGNNEEGFRPKNTVLTVKHGGGRIMLSECFALHRVDGIMED